MNPAPADLADPLVDDVRRIRRKICEEFGSDIDRLCDHLETVARDYDERRGVFEGLSAEAAARLAAAWGAEALRQDDPIVDDVRAIRQGIAQRLSRPVEGTGSEGGA